MVTSTSLLYCTHCVAHLPVFPPHPQRGAELLQQLGGPGGLGTKGKVFAAEQRLGVAVLHDAGTSRYPDMDFHQYPTDETYRTASVETGNQQIKINEI